ncbi:hypothetical protein SEMRO_2006_G310570.1 [Seminavis robusta]|uniref:Uncharacterized protein n=1 Tax=Seminavis robusta TaxID=568900 RepID=A0A9N8EW86_9STRA|nr:hypothetical protein SEMRO_2006_G310570.1 [Seminavis robusta]|eukprot:Sro2006_g310570.1 n/a (177) ;mRNA; r:9457-9987
MEAEYDFFGEIEELAKPCAIVKVEDDDDTAARDERVHDASLRNYYALKEMNPSDEELAKYLLDRDDGDLMQKLPSTVLLTELKRRDFNILFTSNDSEIMDEVFKRLMLSSTAFSETTTRTYMSDGDNLWKCVKATLTPPLTRKRSLKMTVETVELEDVLFPNDHGHIDKRPKIKKN